MHLDQIGLRATTLAAISLYNYIGCGDKVLCDQFATNAMRFQLNSEDIDGIVVVGEGEMDEAPMLYIGEKFGKGSFPIEIAVDPLEGTNLCAKNKENSISVIAIGEKNSILNSPDIYMNKIASCNIKEDDIISINASITDNIKSVAKFKNKSISSIGMITLERDRHAYFVEEARELGIKIKLISDGDIMGILETKYDDNIDFYYGSGGAPEGIIAAAAVKGLGGKMEVKFLPSNDNEIERCKSFKIDIHKIYNLNEIIIGDVAFVATGITNGRLKQIKKENNSFKLNSIIIKTYGSDFYHNIFSYFKI